MHRKLLCFTRVSENLQRTSAKDQVLGALGWLKVQMRLALLQEQSVCRGTGQG